jgi:hypothetical protein
MLTKTMHRNNIPFDRLWYRILLKPNSKIERLCLWTNIHPLYTKHHNSRRSPFKTCTRIKSPKSCKHLHLRHHCGYADSSFCRSFESPGSPRLCRWGGHDCRCHGYLAYRRGLFPIVGRAPASWFPPKPPPISFSFSRVCSTLLR